LNTSFRAYTAGGSRSAVDQVDDSKLMQEMGGNFMASETRKAIESPQNYGFTSVVMGATKDASGAISDSAEAVISFMGGNRSFPVAGVMDDRRHRLFNMQPGDTAQFSTQGRKQQFHMNTDGGFWVGPRDKTLRMGLLDEDSASDQQQQQGGSSGQQQKGQKPRYKDQQKTFRFVDVTKDTTRISGTEAHMMLSDGDSYVHCISQKTYLGGRSGQHQFAKVVTVSGPTANVLGRLDGGASGVAVSRASTVLAVAMALMLGVSLGVNYAMWPAVGGFAAIELASR
jgi:hypothetical protein